jgi:hypothetical protein
MPYHDFDHFQLYSVSYSLGVCNHITFSYAPLSETTGATFLNDWGNTLYPAFGWTSGFSSGGKGTGISGSTHLNLSPLSDYSGLVGLSLPARRLLVSTRWWGSSLGITGSRHYPRNVSCKPRSKFTMLSRLSSDIRYSSYPVVVAFGCQCFSKSSFITHDWGFG